ncbi:MAG TPA: hypothetical protein VK146_16670 [Tabrizicola sp.]|nr:hypothetical protein [Tabrizicola sp.]
MSNNSANPDPDPANERLRHPAPNVIDQRQQQIDPAGRHREDPDARPDANRKQPGGSVHDGERIEKESEG